jgi:hypothetical protein
VRKRDRTPEEKHVDALTKRGILRLGGETSPAEPEPFRHYLRYDMMGRKGQNCRILMNSGTLAQIEFEDGFIATVRRTAIRRS